MVEVTLSPFVSSSTTELLFYFLLLFKESCFEKKLFFLTFCRLPSDLKSINNFTTFTNHISFSFLAIHSLCTIGVFEEKKMSWRPSLNVLIFFPPVWGTLRRLRCVEIFLYYKNVQPLQTQQLLIIVVRLALGTCTHYFLKLVPLLGTLCVVVRCYHSNNSILQSMYSCEKSERI